MGVGWMLMIMWAWDIRLSLFNMVVLSAVMGIGVDDAAMALARLERAGWVRHVAGWFEAEGTIVGDGRTWDQVRFNEFPSMREFMEVVADPRRQQGQEDHREPAMADTYTLFCRPVLDKLREG